MARRDELEAIVVKISDEVYAERAREGRREFQVIKLGHALVDDARAALGRPLALPEANALDGNDPRARPLAALHRQFLDNRADTWALEVAVRVGLYDQSQLHRHFKRIVGVTPGAYARAVR